MLINSFRFAAPGGSVTLLTHTLTQNATTSAIDTTGATFLILAMASYTGAGAPTVTDSKSNSWTALTARTIGGSRMQLFYSFPSSVGSGHTFSESVNNYTGFAVAAFSGVTTYDAENGAGVNSTATPQTGSITPASAGLLVAALSLVSGESASSIDNSFTITDSIVGGVDFGLALAYKIGHTGAVNPAFTKSSTGESALAIASFT